MNELQAFGEYFGETHAVVRSAGAYAQSLRRFDQLADGLDLGRWRQSKALNIGRSAVERLVAGYVETVPVRSCYGDLRTFSSDANRGPIVQQSLDAVWVLSTVLIGGGEGAAMDIGAVMRLAFCGDPGTRGFRTALLGLPFTGGDGPPFPNIPGFGHVPIDKLNRLACYAGLQGALATLGQVGASFQPTVVYPGMTITAINPKAACPGNTVHVSGTGFGASQPTDAIVVFGSTRATVVAGTWSPTGFDVVVPADASECCVSILRVSQQTGGSESFSSALSNLGGVVTECFGTVGIAAGQRYYGLAGRIPDSESAVCAPDGSNHFIGGRPSITSFRTAASSQSPQTIRPGQAITLQWSITNATSATLTIAPATTNSPFAVLPSLPSWFVADPVAGTVTLPPSIGLAPWKANITLSAHNPCGNTIRVLEIDYAPATGVVFVGGGWRSAFHLGAVEALGLILPATPTVCSGTGLGALSAVCAAADYPAPSTLRSFWSASIDQTSWYTMSSAVFVPGGDYTALNNAIWQSEARAEVLSLGALDLIRAYLVPFTNADSRIVSGLFATATSVAADKIMDEFGSAVASALEDAGQTVASYVPIVAIVYAAAKFGIDAYVNSLKQQTAHALATNPSVFDDSGLRMLIAAAVSGIDARLHASGRKLRVPITSLELGRPRYGIEGAAVSDAPVLSNIVANLSTIENVVQASASIPLLGTPVKIGADNYVDGSLRDPVPIGATIEAGAGSVIVIQPNIRAISVDATYDAAGMPRLDGRSSLMRDAQFLDAAVEPFGRFGADLATHAPVGAWRAPVYTVEPTVDLVGLGASMGQIGLVEIMIDYGYMRTYDAIAPQLLFPDSSDPVQLANRDTLRRSLSGSTDAIIGLRVASWEVENRFQGSRVTPTGVTNLGSGSSSSALLLDPEPDAIDAIRLLKLQIRAAIVSRLAIPPASFTVPPVPKPRAEQWFLGWETLGYTPLVSPTTPTPAMPEGDPWVSLSFGGAWTVPAAAAPANIWP